MTSILKIEDVSKIYYPHGLKSATNKAYKLAHALIAVDHVSLEIGEGEIYGLLGPNGAGKSTIIKMITGLVAKDSGTITIAGHDIEKEREMALSNIGAIIETPTLFGNMSAIDNLRYFATLSGGIDEAKIASALDTVGLRDRADDKVRTFSLGMRQRLGIAQAIMSRPRLLVLDEPTNGLDPEWIMTMRTLLKSLAHDYHVAILVCSHILSEIEALCDRIGIIDNGVLVADTTLENIGKLGDDTTIVEYRVDDVARAYDIAIAEHADVIVRDGRLYVRLSESDIPALTSTLVSGGIGIYGVNTKKMTLEELFKRIVVEHGASGGGDVDAR